MRNKFLIFADKLIEMKPYDNEEEKSPSTASEPQLAYGNVTQINYPQGVLEGYMTLEHFGELVHQKLDDCYAHLPSNN